MDKPRSTYGIVTDKVPVYVAVQHEDRECIHGELIFSFLSIPQTSECGKTQSGLCPW